MANTVRTFGRTTSRLLSSSTTSSLLAASHNTQRAAARNFFQSSLRSYSTANAASHIESNFNSYTTITLLSALSGAGVYYITTQTFPQSLPSSITPASTIIPTSLKSTSKAHTPDLKPFTPTQADYQRAYNAIATKLWDTGSDYDDGSYAPVVLRLAWHSSGTYDAATNTGGSNGGLMRFNHSGESTYSANKGLHNAREFLQPLKDAEFPWMSHGDFWTLAGVVAIQEMQGPKIPWRPGRQDLGPERSAPDGRLPDGSRGQDHVREVFRRMGFTTDRECVALSGAHAVGRCHVANSGYEKPWTFSPTVMTNDYYRLLVEEGWEERDPEVDEEWREMGGKRQFRDKTTGGLMMLPTDMALVRDGGMRAWVERYARDGDLFFNDFRDVMVKLFELGVPFEQEERFTFKSTLDDDE